MLHPGPDSVLRANVSSTRDQTHVPANSVDAPGEPPLRMVDGDEHGSRRSRRRDARKNFVHVTGEHRIPRRCEFARRQESFGFETTTFPHGVTLAGQSGAEHARLHEASSQRVECKQLLVGNLTVVVVEREA